MWEFNHTAQVQQRAAWKEKIFNSFLESLQKNAVLGLKRMCSFIKFPILFTSKAIIKKIKSLTVRHIYD